jgi:hypothetical protein
LAAAEVMAVIADFPAYPTWVAAGASTTIDWMDWSAMRRRVVAACLPPGP